MNSSSDNRHASDLAVSVQDLSVRFNDFYAVSRISFTVRRGETFGFLGANGAGKTTTIRVLCGLLPPTEGTVRVAGIDFTGDGEAVKAKVGYMSQRFTLYNDMTVAENLDFIASLRKLDVTVYKQRRRDLFDFISFDRPLETIVRDLPGGTKQHVSLAAALLHDPEIIFLDEPTAGVTPASRSRFWQLIRLLAERGKTVFVTTHYLDEAEQCDRIALMRDGKIIALDSPENLKRVTFQTPLFEFSPRVTLRFGEIAAIAEHPVFLFFEPYGLRFHAAIRSEPEWEQVRGEFEKRFSIRKITPSLEDVFIRTVEGPAK
jgi:ABC-2 type transport system ATP-binding protein